MISQLQPLAKYINVGQNMPALVFCVRGYPVSTGRNRFYQQQQRRTLLASDDYQQQLAEAIYKGLRIISLRIRCNLRRRVQRHKRPYGDDARSHAAKLRIIDANSGLPPQLANQIAAGEVVERPAW